MGLFKSKKKIYVGTTVTRVIEDKAVPNSLYKSVLEAVINNGNIPEYTLENLTNSIGCRADRVYNYGRDHYIHGLPKSNINDATIYEEEVDTVLTALESAPVTIDYSRFGPPNNLHFGWLTLVNMYAYNASTNELASLSTLKGHPVYLKDMVVVVPTEALEAATSDGYSVWGTSPRAGFTPSRGVIPGFGRSVSHTPVTVDPASSQEYLKVTYEWATPNPDPANAELVINTESLTFAFVGYDDEKDYFQVKYQVGGATKYWTYEYGAGTYPSLDSLYADPTGDNGEFFPWMYFRYGGVAENDNPTSQTYIQSKKMCQMIGMDYEDVAQAVNENPDIDDVEQAMMIFAVPANSQNQIELRYLFDFFTNLYDASGSDYTNPKLAQMYVQNPDAVRSNIVIEDNRFQMTLRNGGIYRKRVIGNIGAIGTYAGAKVIETVDIPFETIGGLNGVRQAPVTVYKYKKQITDTVYEDLSIVDLELLFRIFGSKTSTSSDDETILLVPLDKSITQNYTIAEKEELYTRSLHFVFNSVVVVKIKWYQTSIFKFFLVVVAIVITVVSYGTGAKTLYAAIIAATTTQAVVIAIGVFLAKILIGIAISYVLKIFVKAVGVEIGLLLALLVALVAGYKIFSAGSIKGAPFAAELLQVSSGLSSGAQSVLKSQFKDLLNQASEFDQFVEEQLALLEKAQDLLEVNNYIEPIIIFGEKPEDFFNRTVHSGNIGIRSLSSISNYVDGALALPEFQETIGGFSSGI